MRQLTRYPGIRPFEASESHLFFGRDREVRELFGLVKVKPLVNVFAKSGLGKSSLLQAGLRPLLQREGFFPVFVRLQDTSTTATEIALRTLEPYVDKALLARFAPDPARHSLWHYLKARHRRSTEGQSLVPVLLLDQFEEFFAHGEHDRREFAAQLADIAAQRLPDAVQDEQLALDWESLGPEELDWYRPVDARIVLAIRSDRLHELNGLSRELPAVLHHRFEVKPLNSEQAREAIVRPAALIDPRFATAPFVYAPQTLLDIVNNLRAGSADEIESFQLQIICGEVERRLSALPLRTDAAPLEVPPDFLGGAQGIQAILNDYYEDRLSELPSDADRQMARQLIEDQLIADGRRVGVSTATVHLSAALQEALLRSRLIRQSDTHLGPIYEIAHDTLVPPILQSRERRVQAEERARLKAEAAKIRKARRRAIIIGLIAGLLVLGAVVAGLWALQQSQIASRERQTAGDAVAEAEKQKGVAKSMTIQAAAEKVKADSLSGVAKREGEAALANFKEAKAATAAAAAALAKVKEQEGIASKKTKEAEESYQKALAKEKEAQALLEKLVINRNKQADALYLVDLNYDSALVVLLETATLSALEEETALRLLEVGWLENAIGETGRALQAAQGAQKLLGTAVMLPAQVGSFGYPNAQLAQALIALWPKNAIDWQDPKIKMVTVPEGAFDMGSDMGEDEKIHKVTLSAYRIGETEVTQRQWLAVMGENPAYFQPKEGKAECFDCPVEQVSWWDVQRFIYRTSLVTGRLYRLPTEAEWEYAAREGGKDVLFGNGKNIADPAEMNFIASEEYKKEYSVAGEYRRKTTPVKTFSANALGLYDMSGNVWEWCQDWYDDYPTAEQTNPVGSNTGSNRVIRGGGWGNSPRGCRVANRGGGTPAAATSMSGSASPPSETVGDSCLWY